MFMLRAGVGDGLNAELNDCMCRWNLIDIYIKMLQLTMNYRRSNVRLKSSTNMRIRIKKIATSTPSYPRTTSCVSMATLAQLLTAFSPTVYQLKQRWLPPMVTMILYHQYHCCWRLLLLSFPCFIIFPLPFAALHAVTISRRTAARHCDSVQLGAASGIVASVWRPTQRPLLSARLTTKHCSSLFVKKNTQIRLFIELL